MESTILKILLPAVIAFIVGVLITPLVTHFLYKYKAWKKVGGKVALNGTNAIEFNKLKGEDETKTPRMGGIVIWGSVLITLTILYLLSNFASSPLLTDSFFISRSQTWLPFATLLVGALIGFLNDFYDIKHGGQGVKLSVRLLLISILAAYIGWWFHSKLGVTSVSWPFGGEIQLGVLIIPFFIVLVNALYASGVIDGIDGLSGGVFASIFSAYGVVAFLYTQHDLAAFCFMITGAILAFLWFNIPPARFWMTETGSMALTLTLAVVALMTDTIVDGHGISLLPIIGFLLVVTVLSNILQLGYRKLTGKKLFRIAPLHHHFEAIGWPSYKVTMRYWLISMLCAVAGVILSVLL